MSIKSAGGDDFFNTNNDFGILSCSGRQLLSEFLEKLAILDSSGLITVKLILTVSRALKDWFHMVLVRND